MPDACAQHLGEPSSSILAAAAGAAHGAHGRVACSVAIDVEARDLTATLEYDADV